MVICLPTRCGGCCFIAIAIAASSAVYRFCSVLASRVTEYVIGSLSVTTRPGDLESPGEASRGL
jgi:hypothetical protein